MGADKNTPNKNRFEFPPNHRADLDRVPSNDPETETNPQPQEKVAQTGVSHTISQKNSSNLE
jgi:hypothetical protein